ncbi:MAG: response regulator [Kofleriaceae bacterium]|nr:response regulator [Kofleriaceae bacterium]MCL4225745.1 response regulator [Myxococcales bacterium]
MSTPVILCVDDDPDLLAAVVRTLRLDGHVVLSAESPGEALEILARQAVAVLVSDFEMPEMTGVELAVRARDLQPETVRMMLTGKGTVETAIAGINVGEVFRFLSKPFQPDVLRREVAAAIEHHREIADVASERLTVVRRRRVLDGLEAEYPGITVAPRDDHGAYLLDGEARHRVEAHPAFAAFLALLA